MTTTKKSIVLYLFVIFICSIGMAEVEGIKGEPVATEIVDWKDMITRDVENKKLGIITQPVSVPFMPAPEPKRIPKSAESMIKSTDYPTIDFPSPGPEIIPFAAPTTASFSAMTDNNISIPPDTMGAAGPSHLVVVHNGTFRVQPKTGGITSTVTLNSFWGRNNTFDPKVYWDEDVSRWITIACVSSNNANSAVLLGVSSTTDPTQSWYIRSFDADAGNTTWADYPGVGFNSKWIGITMNMFDFAVDSAFQGVKMWVFDKVAATSLGTITPTIFATAFDGAGSGANFTLIPCHTFGSQTNLYILDSGWSIGPDDYVRISRLAGSVGSPGWAEVGFANVQDYSYSYPDAPQLSTSTTIETNDGRIMNAVFRNGTMWYAQTGGLPTASATRTVAMWHRVSTNLAVIEQGMIDGAASVTTHYYFPSIAVNSLNHMGLGFSGSSPTSYIGGYYTNKPSGGSVQTIALLKAGEGVYTKYYGGPRNRWGDYSQTCIDPSDDFIWTIQEYAMTPTGSGTDIGRWGTWWGKFDASVLDPPVELSEFTYELTK